MAAATLRRVGLHPSVEERLARLAPDQRSAATAPLGPILCVAPAGSGKTTTLVARVAWLIASGAAPPESIVAITFNRRAAEELGERLAAALAPLGLATGAVRVRTFHALGLEILYDAGQRVEPLVDRMTVLRQIAPELGPAGWRRLDTAFSRLKLDIGLTAEEVATDPEPGPVARAFLAYEAELASEGGLDFDDLVARSLRLLEHDATALASWHSRATDLLVDEAQDLDRAQLRMALLLAAPANRIFLVGDDDQSIYGWRLADVRRVLDLSTRLPGLQRRDLITNFRCPEPVVERAVRLIEGNGERFAKLIVARDPAPGRLVLAPDASDDDERVRRLLASWRSPDVDPRSSWGILARTNRELLPAAAVALEQRIPFRSERLGLLLEDPRLERLLDHIGARADAPEDAAVPTGDANGADAAEAGADAAGSGAPLLVHIARLRDLAGVGGSRSDTVPSAVPRDPREPEDPPPGEAAPADLVAALLAWAVPYRDPGAFVRAVRERRALLDELRRDDAALVLATAHGTKGLEFDHVAVLGMDADRFPNRRSIDEAPDPARAMADERRLAYVAWTRARRSLTLVYDPAAPSPFLREAFEPAELGAVE